MGETRLGRRLRGLLGMGSTWAVGWGMTGGLLGVGLAIAYPGDFGLTSAASTAAIFSVFGFLGGATFASVLSLAEGRRRFDELSLARFTGWGALGGLVLGSAVAAGDLFRAGDPLIVDVFVTGVATLLGAACAATSLVIARAGEDHGRLGVSDDVDRIGLTEDERRLLLGSRE